MNTVSKTSAYAFATEYVADLVRLSCLRMRIALSAIAAKSVAEGEEGASILFVTGEQAAAGLREDGGEYSGDAAMDELRRRFTETRQAIDAKRAASNAEVLPLDAIAARLGLTGVDLDILELCLAQALHAGVGNFFAYVNNSAANTALTPRVLETVFGYDLSAGLELRSRLAPSAPLRSNHLIEVHEDPGHDYFRTAIVLSKRMPEYLSGEFLLDPATAKYLRFVPPVSFEDLPLPAERITELQNISKHATTPSDGGTLIAFYGAHGNARVSSVAAICAAADLPLLRCDLPELLESASREELEHGIQLALREAMLMGSALVFANLPASTEGEGAAGSEDIFRMLARALGDFSGVCFVTCAERPPALVASKIALVELHFSNPDYALRSQLWARALERYPELGGSLGPDDLAARYALTGGQIERAAREASVQRMLTGETLSARDALLGACHSSNSRNLEELATRVDSKFEWSDIVLPREPQQQLREICTHMIFREQVYGEWGYESKLGAGRGLNVLFSGPPGTGKTMAAGIIAKELGLALYKIDLASVVSKYIGETEKNLSKIFREAAQSQAVLFFDEADALFGKRGEVNDAHDRYANIETSYLLQKMEEYEGVTILATNLSQNMDDAFTRRLHFIVDFPMPDREDRERIWRLAFPDEAPFAREPDFSFLAERLKLSGANIKNIALHAAFYAAADGAAIEMSHIARAARREYDKEGRPMPRADMEAFRELAGGGSKS